MTVGDVGFGHGEQSVIYLEGDALCLRLRKRKNLPSGSVMKRSCWCKKCADTCPVHVLWPFFESLGQGDKPFAGFSAKDALSSFRFCLYQLGIPDAGRYRTHDLRRGHAQDLRERGAPLWEILQAGQWRSPAFLDYLDLESLEQEAVVEANLDESSSDDDGD